MPTSRSGGSGRARARRPPASRRACPSRPADVRRRDARCGQAPGRRSAPRRSGSPWCELERARSTSRARFAEEVEVGELDLRSKLACAGLCAAASIASVRVVSPPSKSPRDPLRHAELAEELDPVWALCEAGAAVARPSRLTVAGVSARFQAPMPADASRSPAQDARRSSSGSLGLELASVAVRLLGVVADELVRLAALLEPGPVPFVEVGAPLFRDPRVGDVADQHVVEAKSSPSPGSIRAGRERARAARGARACCRGRPAPRAGRGARPHCAAKSRPITAARSISARSAGSSVSRRLARRASIDGGTDRASSGPTSSVR